MSSNSSDQPKSGMADMADNVSMKVMSITPAQPETSDEKGPQHDSSEFTPLDDSASLTISPNSGSTFLPSLTDSTPVDSIHDEHMDGSTYYMVNDAGRLSEDRKSAHHVDEIPVPTPDRMTSQPVRSPTPSVPESHDVSGSQLPVPPTSPVASRHDPPIPLRRSIAHRTSPAAPRTSRPGTSRLRP